MTISRRRGGHGAVGGGRWPVSRAWSGSGGTCRRAASLERGTPTCHPERSEGSIRVPPAVPHWILRCAQDDKSAAGRPGRVAEVLSLPRGTGSRSATSKGPLSTPTKTRSNAPGRAHRRGQRRTRPGGRKHSRFVLAVVSSAKLPTHANACRDHRDWSPFSGIAGCCGFQPDGADGGGARGPGSAGTVESFRRT